jgi:hypothetical protein
MKSYDIIGWTDEDGAVFCADHRPRAASPIFADSEWDYVPSCEECGELLSDVSLTSEGMAAVRAAIFDGLLTQEQRQAYISVADANGIDLTRYAYGIGAAGCLYDSVGGPFDTAYEAIEALRDVLGDDDEWREVYPGFWEGPGTYYAEVFDVDEDWEGDDEDWEGDDDD